MTKVAYFECPTGLAGDMCLGALVHAGVPLEYLTEQLSSLGIAQEFRLRSELVQHNGQSATKVHVDLLNSSDPATLMSHEAGVDPHPTFGWHEVVRSPDHQHSDHPVHAHETTSEQRHLPEIEALIQSAHLPQRVEAWSLAIFRRLAAAEGAVHGIAPEAVHFHEVGATDAIVDIVGTCLGLDWLQVEQIYCSALPVGGGTVRAAHGQLPVPTPAVLKLWELRQVPIYSNGIERELVTPTGAAIATTLATQFGGPPAMTLRRVGLGAGSRHLPMPNILRLWLGESDRLVEAQQQVSHSHHASLHRQQSDRSIASHSRQPDGSTQQETIAVLETQIDDLSPQAIGYVLEALLSKGALDVFTQAIGMKKSRPGILLTVICYPEQIATCKTLIFEETTTLGIRQSLQSRTTLPRHMQTIQTKYGSVNVKVTRRGVVDAKIVDAQPEYEDCSALAKQHSRPWREIHHLALEAWQQASRPNIE
jgi:hypothetical protein